MILVVQVEYWWQQSGTHNVLIMMFMILYELHLIKIKGIYVVWSPFHLEKVPVSATPPLSPHSKQHIVANLPHTHSKTNIHTLKSKH